MISCDTTMDLSVFYTFCGFDPKRLKKKKRFSFLVSRIL